jgi:fused signal recognition particle receptor
MSILGRIREGLSRTKQQIVEQFEDLVKGADAPERRSRAIEVATLDALEELLISADLGMAASAAVIAAVKAQPRDGSSLRDLVKKEIRRIFDAVDTPVVAGQKPKVVLIVGVNGTGKTTTVGKLANLLKSQGKQPLICAADSEMGRQGGAVLGTPKCNKPWHARACCSTPKGNRIE